LQFTKKEGNPEDVIEDFSNSLLETYLRDKLEKDNKTIRETIVQKAINGPLDS
jgi:His-Xaa-Ser system protein HxsD